jgi:pimeloyl-ACP methyl ester carboxylesterase
MVLRAPPVDVDAFAGITVPTLVIVGSRDPLQRQVEQATRGTGVTVHVVTGASHLFEEPGTLDEALEATTTWFTTHLLPANGGMP